MISEHGGIVSRGKMYRQCKIGQVQTLHIVYLTTNREVVKHVELSSLQKALMNALYNYNRDVCR